jgi:hypothetical protein
LKKGEMAKMLKMIVKEIDSDTGKVNAVFQDGLDLIRIDKIEYFAKPTAVFMILKL